MNALGMQASVNNLVQMDRHQSDTHRTPVVNQEQNALIDREQAARRTEMPVDPEQPEGKNVDSENSKRDKPALKARVRKSPPKATRQGKADGSGRFVDVTV
jgi:hypothetical protein